MRMTEFGGKSGHKALKYMKKAIECLGDDWDDDEEMDERYDDGDMYPDMDPRYSGTMAMRRRRR